MSTKVYKNLLFTEQTAPGTPGAGFVAGPYAKADHRLYAKGSDGVEFALGGTFARGYSALIGNGSLTTITVNHALATTAVQVTVINQTTGRVEYVDWSLGAALDANNVYINFSSAPATNSLKVVVMGI